ncbi:unnamed protein product [Rhizopus stolonifer]
MSNQLHCHPQVYSDQRMRFQESSSSQRTEERKPRYESTQPSRSRPLNINLNAPWLLSTLSYTNMSKEDSDSKISAEDVQRVIPKLMKGFRCNVPYAYHHRLDHPSLSRPTEFVRQIPNPSIPYLKKESWPVYNKYIGAPLNRDILKRVCHKAADPDYIVPIVDCPEMTPVREPGEIVVEKANKSVDIMDFIAGIQASSKNLAPHADMTNQTMARPAVKQKEPAEGFKMPERVSRPRATEPVRQELPRVEQKRSQGAVPPVPVIAAETPPARSGPVKPTIIKPIEQCPTPKYDALSRWHMLEEVFYFEQEYNSRRHQEPMEDWLMEDISQPELFYVEEAPVLDLMKLAKRYQMDNSESNTMAKKSLPTHKLDSPECSPIKRTVDTENERTYPSKLSKPIDQRKIENKITEKPVGKKHVEKSIEKPVERKSNDQVEKKSPMVESKIVGKTSVEQKPKVEKNHVVEQKSIEKKSTFEPKLIEKKASIEKAPVVEQKPIKKPTTEKKVVEQRPHAEKRLAEKPGSQKAVEKNTASDMELEEGETISPTPSPPQEEERGQNPTEISTNKRHKKKEAEQRPTKKRTIEKAKEPEQPPTFSLSATGPKSNTMEQCKIFTFMFKNLAHTYKKRGDTEADTLKSTLDHFQALCNYIISYHYAEKQTPNEPPSSFSATWKSVLPFADSLLPRLKAQNQTILYGTCLRLISMIRYHIFERMHGETRSLIDKQLNKNDQSENQKYLRMSSNLLNEYHKALNMYAASESLLSFFVVSKELPQSFQEVCFEGNLLRGIVIGGEAGTEFSPSFPFTFHDKVLHAAIVAKCFLNEIVNKSHLEYQEIKNTEDYM